MHCTLPQAAIDGQLWGPALLLATACGDKAFADTATAMAQAHMVPGTPLRTVALMLAGRPDLVLAQEGVQEPGE